MAERTIQRRKNGDNVTAIGTGTSIDEPASENRDDGIPVTIESDGTVKPATIDDYELDGADNGNGTTFVDPASGSGNGSESGSGRKPRSDRGTRRGSRTSRKSATETTSSVANMLFVIHLGMANFMKFEELALTPEESKAYAQAITNLSQLYDLPVIGEKALAWTNLAMTMGSIYGPRFVAMKMRKNRKPQVVEMHFESPATGA